MASCKSICPLWSVCDAWWSDVCGYMLGSVAAVAGEALAVGGVALGAMTVGLRMVRREAPNLCVHRQVPSRLKGSRIIGPSLYGWVLGTAVLTFVVSELVYVYVGSVVVFGDPTTGTVAGASYGSGYAMTVLLLGRRQAGDDPLALTQGVVAAVAHVRRPAAFGAIAAVGLLLLGAA